MGELFQVVYTSTAAESFSRAELLDMLKGSVQRNSKAGITGLLLYQDRTFMQALEGEKAVVTTLYEKISHDPRHRNVIPLLQGPIAERHFPNSAMAFRDLETPELKKLPGYSEFLNTPLSGEPFKKNLPLCEKLLLLFKQNIR